MVKILIVTAVEKEKNAVEKSLKEDSRFVTALCGFGPVEAGVRVTLEIMKHQPDLVINAGVAGGFPGRAAIGDVIIGTESILADLGAESARGFIGVEELGFGRSRWYNDSAEKAKLHHAKYGQILTLSTVTGTEKRTAELAEKFPLALAEAMEGAGAASAAAAASVAFLEIRTISNMIGPRDKGAWEIETALHSLTLAMQELKEVL